MPSKNSIKQFSPHALYHVYNRGVARQPIYLDTQDYDAFLRRLKLILLPKEQAEKLQISGSRIRLYNMYGDLNLQAFCLMPNHFHLLLQQADDPTAISRFISTLNTSYSMYFNRKYERVGPVFQGRFKAAPVDNDAYYTHLVRYIHCNPIALKANIYTYPYSSQQFYFKQSEPWLNTASMEEMFDSPDQYFEFVESLRDIDKAAAQFDL